MWRNFKNAMKKIFYLLMAAFAVLCVSASCSKDDEGKGGSSYSELIVGTWQMEKSYIIDENRYSEGDKTIANFKSSGDVTMLYDEGGSASIKWRIVDSTLYLGNEGDWETYLIKTLDKKEMIITYVENGKEVERLYFSRVK